MRWPRVCYDAGRLRRAFALPGLKTLEEVLVDFSRAQALRGAHNGQNAAAAFSACERLGLPHDEIGLGMRSFPGLAHRMEQVGQQRPRAFRQRQQGHQRRRRGKGVGELRADSSGFLGGKAKAGGIEPLRPLFGRVAKAYLIGEAAQEFARTLTGQVAFEQCGTLDVAVAAAARDAAESDAAEPVVLLSPACASYDQYANFEKRGDAFRDEVKLLLRKSAQAALFD